MASPAPNADAEDAIPVNPATLLGGVRNASVMDGHERSGSSVWQGVKAGENQGESGDQV